MADCRSYPVKGADCHRKRSVSGTCPRIHRRQARPSQAKVGAGGTARGAAGDGGGTCSADAARPEIPEPVAGRVSAIASERPPRKAVCRPCMTCSVPCPFRTGHRQAFLACPFRCDAGPCVTPACLREKSGQRWPIGVARLPGSGGIRSRPACPVRRRGWSECGRSPWRSARCASSG